MSWNYRIMKKKVMSDEEYDIYEVYYDCDGNITNWTMYPVGVHGSSVEELYSDFKYHEKAFSKPVLDYDQLSEEFEEKAKKK